MPSLGGERHDGIFRRYFQFDLFSFFRQSIIVHIKTIRISKKQILGLVLLGIVLVGGMAIYWLPGEPGAGQKGKTAARQPAYRMHIEGLKFYGMNQGQRVISIAGDLFTIRKGKIGFFSTGLTQTASIENARIDIYATPIPPSGKISGHSNGKPTQEGDSPAEKWHFGNLLADEVFSSLLPTKSISAIEMAPVTVVLHGGESVLTRISAAAAAIRLREQDILFKGGVRISSGEAELTTEQLLFAPRTSRLKVDSAFVLKQGARNIEGTSLTTDLFLQPF